MFDCSGAVKVDVAYTESLLVMTKGKPVTIGSLDTMNGHALLQTYGGSLSVQGLDGSARLESRGGSVQVSASATLTSTIAETHVVRWISA